MISYFLNIISSYSVDFFVKEDALNETSSKFSSIPIIFLTGFVISLIIIYFLRKKLGKKKAEIKEIHTASHKKVKKKKK